MKLFWPAITSTLLATACASSSKPDIAISHVPTTRVPAQTPDAGSDTPAVPPMVSSHALWVYSWSNNAIVLKDPKVQVSRAITHAQTCLGQLAASNQEVPGCEGNGMAAGPGLYVCDNPFTSHDYGANLLMLHLTPSAPIVGLATGSFSPPPASGGLDRTVVANAAFAAILYDFRVGDFGSRAMVIRNAAVINPSETKSLSAKPKTYNKFKTHAAHSCAADTPVPEIVSAWSDQMEFMALTFDDLRAPNDAGFAKNGQLNSTGIAAAVAADVVAIPDAALAAKIALLSKRHPDLKELLSTNSCGEIEAENPRACLAREIYMTLTSQEGSPNHPTNSWPQETAQKAFVELGLLLPAEAHKVKTARELFDVVTADFKKVPAQVRRANDAFSCVLAVREQTRAANFGQLGADPGN